MDAKKKSIETIRITTGSMTEATRTTIIGMTTKIVPTVSTSAISTRSIALLPNLNRENKPRIGIGVTVIQITTEASRASSYAAKTGRRSASSRDHSHFLRNPSGDVGRNDRHDALPSEFVHEQERRLGFIENKAESKSKSHFMTVVLHD
jgi:hypothetical protein